MYSGSLTGTTKLFGPSWSNLREHAQCPSEYRQAHITDDAAAIKRQPAAARPMGVTAARLLVLLRSVCTAAGTPEAFAEFMTATAEANRRRPTCIDEFVRAGLIRPDHGVVDA